MKFGPVPTIDALGAILAHSLMTPKGMVKKGRALAEPDITRLIDAGFNVVMAARLDPTDVGEDQAAARIARALAGPGVTVSEPFTGRANLFAAASGLVQVPVDTVTRLNRIDEAITVASLSPDERVGAGQMLATVKIIPFAAAEAVVAEAEKIAAEAPLRVAAFANKRAGLVLTRLPATKQAVLDKRTKVTADRLASLGSELARSTVVPHDIAAVEQAILDMRAEDLDPILVFAASAIVDRADVIPAAVVAAGGEIIHLGMPVDPGNLLLTARLGNTDVLGMPSCAGSPKLNGFDWVLERRFAGLPAGRDEIAGMGVGGLLKEIATRPQPRAPAEPTTERQDGQRMAPRVACLILAAGRSSRMGANNKLEAQWRGRPLVRYVAEAALASTARPVIVVTGHRADHVARLLEGLDVKVVHNPDYAEGLSTSLRTGLDALPQGIEGIIIALGDMPRITGQELDRLVAGFSPKEGRAIVVPVHDGKRGNPVLWSAEFIPEMRRIEGDVGAKHLLIDNADRVAEVASSAAALTDVDTPEALALLRADES